MPNSRWQAVLFDFDYTLADSSPGIIACANYALAEMHLPAAEPEHIRSTIGLALTETFTRLTGSADPRQREAFARLFVYKADEVMVASTTLYDAAKVVIPLLDDAGYLLGVVSTKYRDRLEGVLQRERLLQHMRVVVGGDQVAQPKPAPDGLVLAATTLGLEPAACLYVGDTPIDAQAAASAGMAFAGVLSGTSTSDSFPLGTILLSSLSELPGWLQGERTSNGQESLG